mgnify:CR=1 FL=1
MAKTKYYTELSESERGLLTKILCEGNVSDRTLMRAKILLMSDSAQKEKVSIRELAERLGTTETTIKTVRTEYATNGLEAALYRKKRVVTEAHKPYKRKINDDVIQKILALAASVPPKGHRRWSAQLLCDAAMEKGIVEHIGLTTMCQILKDAKTKGEGRSGEKS